MFEVKRNTIERHYAKSAPDAAAQGLSKFFLLAGIVVAFIVIVAFVGMNMQHAQDSKAQESGQVKPNEAPLHEKDLGKAPVQPK